MFGEVEKGSAALFPVFCNNTIASGARLLLEQANYPSMHLQILRSYLNRLPLRREVCTSGRNTNKQNKVAENKQKQSPEEHVLVLLVLFLKFGVAGAFFAGMVNLQRP